jgi:hypothetical protein
MWKLAAALLLGFAGSAQAQLSSYTDYATGYTIVRDDKTGLDWLSLDATLGIDYRIVATELWIGGSLHAFTNTGSASVDTLFKDAGVVFSSFATPISQDVQWFFDAIGGDSSGPKGMNNVALQPYMIWSGIEASNGTYFVSDDGAAFGPTYQNDRMGTWLVREVPEPSTYALMLGGLGWLIFLSRRRVMKRD